MKVALESGEVLDIAILDGERVVGTVSLQLKDMISTSRAGRPAGSSAKAASSEGGEGRKTRKRRKPMSDEARARMAAAQKARWEKKRSGAASQ